MRQWLVTWGNRIPVQSHLNVTLEASFHSMILFIIMISDFVIMTHDCVIIITSFLTMIACFVIMT